MRILRCARDVSVRIFVYSGHGNLLRCLSQFGQRPTHSDIVTEDSLAEASEKLRHNVRLAPHSSRPREAA